jgi:drug/metabolite transporter (DMT)-like permease
MAPPSLPLPVAAGPGGPTGSQAAVVGVVLLAAVLHASWNALLKDGRDRLVMVVLLDLTAMALSALLLPLTSWPARAAWGLLGLSVLLHTGYKVLLMQSYQVGDLNQVYPLARGTAPLLVAAVAGLFLGERLGPWQLAGLVGVCGGLVLLLERGRPSPRKRPMLALAVATGVAIAAYTVTDGLGVRRSGTDVGYVAWLFLLGGLPIPLYTAATQPRRLAAGVRDRLGVGLVAGALSLAAYGLVLWAQRRGALAVVAALRETSVLVAALIGTLWFSERFGRRRVVAATLIAAGIVLLNLPR